MPRSTHRYPVRHLAHFKLGLNATPLTDSVLPVSSAALAAHEPHGAPHAVRLRVFARVLPIPLHDRPAGTTAQNLYSSPRLNPCAQKSVVAKENSGRGIPVSVLGGICDTLT
jgi:hypothetical protein